MKTKLIALTLAFISMLGLTGIGQFQQADALEQDTTTFKTLSLSSTVCEDINCAPSIAVDNGDVFAVWVEPTEDGTNSVIKMVSSTDEGNTFSTPQSIDVTMGSDVQDPIIGLANNGDLLLVWTDERDGDVDVYASVSQDNGITWTWDANGDVHNISNNDGDSLNPTLDLGNDSTFVIAWSDDSATDGINPNGYRNIFVCAGRLDDLALTQTFSVSQGSVSSSRYEAEAPALAVNPNRPLSGMYIVWEQEGDRAQDVFFHQTTAFNPLNISNNDDTDSKQVDIIVRNPDLIPGPDSSQQVITVWVERVDGEDQVMLSIANDIGLALTDPGFSDEPINLSQSNESASNPTMAINDESNFFVTWTQEDESTRNRNTIQLVSMVDVLGLPQEASNPDLNFSASNVSVGADNNNVYLIWVEENLTDGSTNIVFSKQNLDNIRIF